MRIKRILAQDAKVIARHVITTKDSEMRKISKYLSVLAISAAILAPTVAHAAWGPWYYHSQSVKRLGFNYKVLECVYKRETTGGGGVTAVKETEWKRVEVGIYDPFTLPKCPDASTFN